jgi:hypothetical protein
MICFQNTSNRVLHCLLHIQYIYIWNGGKLKLKRIKKIILRDLDGLKVVGMVRTPFGDQSLKRSS